MIFRFSFLIFLCALFLGITASIIVGRDKCTFGPSYWCSNLQNAKSCGAVTHCIKTVWEKQHVPEDTDSICQICLDMVKQARDQLESNETQEELKEVFEGSCDLIPIKVVKTECKRMADDFIPELVEALASQMNPQVVCSTAGLCNNAAIDKLLEEYEAQKATKLFTCNKCTKIGDEISTKFHMTSRDEVLDRFLGVCGRMSSFSDACSSIILTHFDNIYKELANNMETDKICHMSGACSSKFHKHDTSPAEIETDTETSQNKEVSDDISCELCEQLVKHFRDILIANTTEAEFKSVLEGLCTQTKGFKKECLSIVEQYYSIIYETLVNNLDANGACFLIGICHKGEKINPPHMPLLPDTQNVPPRRRLGENEKVYTNEQIQAMVLPIDKLMGAKSNLALVDSGEKCALCTYFLHFVQEELSDARNEDEIKEVVGKTCEKFPMSIRSSCHNFVNLYGDAIIALLVQEIDPREVCPQLKFCPKNLNQKDVDIFAPNPIYAEVNEKSKPSCPLCELVLVKAEEFIENPKSKASAKKALEKVCSRLPPKPQLQCNDFIETYYDELLEKLVSDLTPKAICNLLKLCPGTEELDFRVGIEKVNYIPHVDTNEIPDYTVNGQFYNGMDPTTDSGECLLCTEVVGGAVSKISKGMTKSQVEDVLFRECSRFHAYEGICDNFVKNNVDQIYDLLAKDLTPKQLCQKLSLCAVVEDLNIDEAIIVNVVALPSFPEKSDNQFSRVALSKTLEVEDDPICVLCEFIMAKLETQLKDKTTQEEIKETVENICNYMPKSISKQCTKFIDEYAELIISLIDTVPPKEICVQMSLCTQVKKPHLVGESECTYGPTHFCSDEEIAKKCNATKYCQQKKLGRFA